jgi:hypothetical protein
MALAGKKREITEYTKKVGWFEFAPEFFNPTKEQLEEFLGRTFEKDVEYLGEDDEGNKKVVINVWGTDTKSGDKYSIRFALINKRVVSKNTGKIQYINQVGDTQYAEDKDNLMDWFSNFMSKEDKKTGEKKVLGQKTVREAIVGEEALYKFLRATMKLDYFDPETNMVLDTKDLLKGDVREMNSWLKDERAGTVVAVATVRTVEEDDPENEGETTKKEYQSVYNKAFLPGTFMKVLRTNPSKKPKQVEKFLEEIEGEHGIRDYWVRGELHDYDPSKNIAANDETVDNTAELMNDETPFYDR